MFIRASNLLINLSDLNVEYLLYVPLVVYKGVHKCCKIVFSIPNMQCSCLLAVGTLNMTNYKYLQEIILHDPLCFCCAFSDKPLFSFKVVYLDLYSSSTERVTNRVT